MKKFTLILVALVAALFVFKSAPAMGQEIREITLQYMDSFTEPTQGAGKLCKIQSPPPEGKTWVVSVAPRACDPKSSNETLDFSWASGARRVIKADNGGAWVEVRESAPAPVVNAPLDPRIGQIQDNIATRNVAQDERQKKIDTCVSSIALTVNPEIRATWAGYESCLKTKGLVKNSIVGKINNDKGPEANYGDFIETANNADMIEAILGMAGIQVCNPPKTAPIEDATGYCTALFVTGRL